MEKNRKIDNLFKEELGSYTETPPPMVWEALEKRLSAKRKERMFPYRWLWYFSILAFMALAGGAVVWKMAANMHTNAATAAANATDNMTTKPATMTITASNTTANTNTTQHKKRTKSHYIAKTTTPTINNQQRKTALHRSNKNHKNTTAVAGKNKNTDDALYADTDDGQYTVGYSSNSRRNTGPSNESDDDDISGYAVQQRSQHNMVVAETDVTPENEGDYGSVVVNSRPQAPKSKPVVEGTHERIVVTNSKPAYRHAGTKKSPAEKNNQGIAGINNVGRPKTMPGRHSTKNGRNMIPASTHVGQTANRKNAQVLIAATASPVLNTKKLPKHIITASSAPVHKVEVVKNTNSIAVARTSGNKTQAHPAALKETHTATRAKIAGNTTIDTHNTGNNPVAANTIKDKHVTPALIKRIHTAAKNTTAGNSNAGKNEVAANTAGRATVPAAQHNGADAAIKKNTTADNNADNKAGNTVAVTKGNNKKMPVAGNKHTQTIVNTPLASSAVAAGKTKKPHTAKKAVNNSHVMPAASSKAIGAVVKNTSKQAVAHKYRTKAAKQNNQVAATANTLAANTNNPKSVGKPAAKKVVTGNKQPAVKGQEKANEIAVTTAVKKPAGAEKQAVAKVASVANSEVAVPGNAPAHKTKEQKATQTATATAATNTAVARNSNTPGKKGTGRKAAKNGSKAANPSSTPAPQPPVYVFNSSLNNRTLEQETEVVDNLKVNNMVNEQPLTGSNSGQLPGTFKTEEKAAKPDSVASVTPVDSATKHSLFSSKFEYGVKAGYEGGFSKFSANKFVVSPYLQYNLNDKFAIMTQPGFKVSHVDGANVGSPKSYYDTTGGKFTLTATGILVTQVQAGTGSSFVTILDTLRKYNYAYDSVVKSYKVAGTYTEMELPLLLKYKISRKLSVYGGANALYSRLTEVTEHTANYTGNVNANTVFPYYAVVTLPNKANIYFPSLSNITTYKEPKYPSPKGDLFRLGYMLGFSYEYKKRWLIDALVQQAMVKANNEGGTNTNAPLSLPYFRFTLGYKLSK